MEYLFTETTDYRQLDYTFAITFATKIAADQLKGVAGFAALQVSELRSDALFSLNYYSDRPRIPAFARSPHLSIDINHSTLIDRRDSIAKWLKLFSSTSLACELIDLFNLEVGKSFGPGYATGNHYPSPNGYELKGISEILLHLNADSSLQALCRYWGQTYRKGGVPGTGAASHVVEVLVQHLEGDQ